MALKLSHDEFFYILQFAVDFEYRKQGLYSKKEQIECIVNFELVNCELSKAMEHYFNLFWSNVLKRDVHLNLEVFHEEELEKQMIKSKTLKRKVLLMRMYKRKMQDSMEIVKILMLGPSGCGKSALVYQFFAEELSVDQSGWSCQVIEDSLKKRIHVDDEWAYVDIYEMRGYSADHEYEALRPIAIQTVENFVMVVSDNDQASLIETRRQLDIIVKEKEFRTDIPIVFAINKVDRDDSKSRIDFWREKIEEMIKEYKLINVGILETCVNTKITKNVNELFEECVKRYRYGTWKDVELLKEVISQDVLIFKRFKKKKKCICM